MNHPTLNPAAPVLARRLATMASLLTGGDTPHKDRLHHVADLLQGVNPNTEAALCEARRGLAEADAQADPDKPEVWLLQAVAAVLAGPAQPVQAGPSAHLAG